MRYVALTGLIVMIASIASIASAMPVDTAPIHPSLSPGTTYEFNISLNAETVNTTKVYEFGYYSPFFAISFNPRIVISTNETHTYPIAVAIEIPSSYPAGLYNGELILSDGNSSYEIPLNITINSLINYTISPLNISLTTSSGQNGTINLTFKNNGNADTGFNLSPFDFFTFEPDYFMLFKGNEQKVDMDFEIPLNYIGNYTKNYNIGSNNVNISIVVVDDTIPNITSITHQGYVQIDETFKLEANITDNIGIYKASLFLPNQTEKEMILQSNGLYYTYLEFNTTGTKHMNITAWDRERNSATYEANVTIGCVPFETETLVHIPKAKVGGEFSTLLFSTSTPIKIFIDDISISTNVTDNSTPYSYRISIDGESSEIAYNKAYTPEKSLKLLLNFSQNVIYDGHITLELPDKYCESDRQINFSGKAGAYTVTPYFSGIIFGKEFTVTPYDMGTYENSYLLACNRLPVDTTEEDVYMGCSKSLMEAEKSKYEMQLSQKNAEIDDANKRAADANFRFLMLCFAVLIGGLAAYYWINIRPEQSRM